MNLSQKFELKKLLIPELTQSLKILTLTLPDLKCLIEAELVNNPILEEKTAPTTAGETRSPSVRTGKRTTTQSLNDDPDPLAQLTKTESLQEVLSRQLELSGLAEPDLAIGREIIGSLDDNGYLISSVNDIAASVKASHDQTEKILRVIHKFEPYGVAARNIQECLTIQCDMLHEEHPLIRRIITDHLEDIAKRKYELIAHKLGAPVAEIIVCLRKITCLDPKPGRNYSSEQTFNILPDIFIDEKDGELEISLNKEDLPGLYINEEYRTVLKDPNIPAETKEFLKEKLSAALELMRAISRRHGTLRKVITAIADIQKEALISGLSQLKPLTFKDVAENIGMHESTVCRVVINKYAETPQGLIAIKDLFCSSIQQENGESVSSSLCKNKIREIIEAEDKNKPFSDDELAGILLRENNIKVARRTVAKYREELNFLSSTMRKQR